MNLDNVLTTGREPHGSSDDSSLIDFSANTNPRVPEGIERVYREAFDRTRGYPTEPPTKFRELAAEYVDCDPEQVIPTPGGLAAVRRAIDLLVNAGDSVLVPSPSFAEYAREVQLQGGHAELVSETDILTANPEAHAVAIVCNPNNPTGTFHDRQAILSFADRCRETNTTLLIDEAFLGFTHQQSVAGTEGVVVARALTKLFGLPGLRSGFTVATGRLREALTTARRPWNLSAPALATAEFCLQQADFIDDTRERVRRERSRMADRLTERYRLHDSGAPFLLIDVGERDVNAVVARARERGIAIRDATTFRGLDSHVRVAVRLQAENNRLIEVLESV